MKNKKTKIKIVRGVKEGRKFVHVFVYNKEEKKWVKEDQHYTVSRIVTGTDKEDGAGIFNSGVDEVRIEKGDFYKKFKWEGEILNLEKQETSEIVRILKNRTKEVKEWVKRLDHEESVEFEL